MHEVDTRAHANTAAVSVILTTARWWTSGRGVSRDTRLLSASVKTGYLAGFSRRSRLDAEFARDADYLLHLLRTRTGRHAVGLFTSV